MWLALTVRAVLVLLCILLLYWRVKHARFAAKVNKIPGVPPWPIIGNGLDLLISPVELFARQFVALAQFGPVWNFWVLEKPMIGIQRARDVEAILQGMTHHAKSENYQLLHNWMGLGLLTSRDEKWRVHRKALTPAFHFNILTEFLPIFNKHAYKLTTKLADEPAATTKQGFNIFPYSSMCGLDIICESSMGCTINAQEGQNSSYVQAVIKMNELLIRRYFTIWLRPDFLYNLSFDKRQQDENLKIINSFTDKVINERKKYFETAGFSELLETSKEGSRKRLAFIDLLLAAQASGAQFMSQKDIRDQVSTFMFEGHDTVSTATSWVLFLLGTYPEAQERVVEELEQVFGDSGRAPDMNDLANLKYLEMCIKETLRLYPSVPFFERKIEQDVEIEHHVIPAGCTVAVNVYVLHRDHEFWPDPEKFDPERFLPENSQSRHPYAYVPFSAGPRNCIGQKFALLEEKTVVSTVLRRFRVEAAHSRDEAELQVAMVLRPRNGLRIRIFDRESHPKLRVNE